MRGLPESVVMLANHYSRIYGFELRDDLIGEGCLAFVKIERPAPEGFTERRWEYLCLRRDITDWLRKQGLIAHGGRPKKLADLELNLDVIPATKDHGGIFPVHVLRRLNDADLLLCVWLWEGYTQREIAEGYGVSEGRVSQRIGAIREKLEAA